MVWLLRRFPRLMTEELSALRLTAGTGGGREAEPRPAPPPLPRPPIM